MQNLAIRPLAGAAATPPPLSPSTALSLATPDGPKVLPGFRFVPGPSPLIADMRALEDRYSKAAGRVTAEASSAEAEPVAAAGPEADPETR